MSKPASGVLGFKTFQQDEKVTRNFRSRIEKYKVISQEEVVILILGGVFDEPREINTINQLSNQNYRISYLIV